MISAVTLAELSVGPLVAGDDGEERPGRPICRSAGRKPAARAYDTLIAAAAIAADLPLFACNPADFDAIAGLDVRALPHPDRSDLTAPPDP